MRTYMRHGVLFFAIFAFLLVGGLEITLAQQTSTFEGSVASITTGAFSKGVITVKGDKGEVMDFAVGRKTVYVPHRYPGVGERVKITYSLIRGQNAAYQVDILATPATPPATAPSASPTGTRPCVANLTMTGSFLSGRTVKSFQEYPNASKGPAFTYLISKLTSIGYKISASDRESGLISASYQVTFGKGETSTMNAVVTDLKPAGIRVDLTFKVGGTVSFNLEEAKREFCSILEGVPTDQKTPATANPPGK